MPNRLHKQSIMATEKGKNRSYPIKLWLLSIGVLAPILLSLGASMNHTNYFNRNINIGVIILFVLFGLLLSSPTFIVTLFSFIKLSQKIKSILLLKVIINLIAILGVIITFSFIGVNSNKGLYIGTYCISIVISSLFLSIKNKNAWVFNFPISFYFFITPISLDIGYQKLFKKGVWGLGFSSNYLGNAERRFKINTDEHKEKYSFNQRFHFGFIGIFGLNQPGTKAYTIDFIFTSMADNVNVRRNENLCVLCLLSVLCDTPVSLI